MTRKVLSVPDISCEHCERSIVGAVTPIAGVSSVSVDIPGKLVTVDYDEAKVSIARIKAAVEAEEYAVAAIR